MPQRRRSRWTAETRESSLPAMRGRFARQAVIHLALAAMMLRALLPAGWMPGARAATGSFITICTMNGFAKLALGADGQPVKHAPQDDGRQHDVCPFAAAPHFATTSPALAVSLPHRRIMQIEAPCAFASAGSIAHYAPQSPRAPPAIA
jgi:hypothetical protein